ncbi:hypothetical protein ACQ1Y6_23890, partial [Enterococcus faecalis]|uniref:hypothetical protein n=1 Tax=Enterococcus faecalis TaxID=1351 RepID=UPI00403F5F86
NNPGKENNKPKRGDGEAKAQLNSTKPTKEKAEVTAEGEGKRKKIQEGKLKLYVNTGKLRKTLMGHNSEEGSTHKLVVGE